MQKKISKKTPLIIITGPTAVGKSTLSIEIAKRYNGSIISADSMQVYKYMDIGTNKIRREEMKGIPHYLLNVLEPCEDFNVYTFQSMAKAALEEIYSCGRLPILVGGTGFYIQALLYDIDFEEEPGKTDIRKELEDISQTENGGDELYELLRSIDPESADEIHRNNIKRVIRAIEYYRLTGEKISEHNRRERVKESPYDFIYFVLNNDRKILYPKIETRVDEMLEEGLVDEVRKLMDMGCTKDMVSMQGLGYKEILEYLTGECTLEDSVYRIKRDTRHYAKRQITWFKRERNVTWINKNEYAGNEEMLDVMCIKIDRLLADCN